MDNATFKRYLQAVEQKAVELQKNNFSKMALIKLIQDKHLQKVDNYREAMQLPPISQMTTEQLDQFFEALEPFQDGDVFLTKRELETVDHSDLAGIKTWREARERLALRAGIPIEQLPSFSSTAGDLAK
jgi:L-lactate utilization protein LutC